mgnify:FL=1
MTTPLLLNFEFYHSEKLQSTKTVSAILITLTEFYHSEKLQSTKTKE